MVKITGRVKAIDLGTENGAIAAMSNLQVLGQGGVFLNLSLQVPTEVAYQLKLMDAVEVDVNFPSLNPPPAPAPAPAPAEPAATAPVTAAENIDS
jgi:hypothetical protein